MRERVYLCMNVWVCGFVLFIFHVLTSLARILSCTLVLALPANGKDGKGIQVIAMVYKRKRGEERVEGPSVVTRVPDGWLHVRNLGYEVEWEEIKAWFVAHGPSSRFVLGTVCVGYKGGPLNILLHAELGTSGLAISNGSDERPSESQLFLKLDLSQCAIQKKGRRFDRFRFHTLLRYLQGRRIPSERPLVEIHDVILGVGEDIPWVDFIIKVPEIYVEEGLTREEEQDREHMGFKFSTSLDTVGWKWDV